MKITYDRDNDLLYIWFADEGTQSFRTETLAPGVHVDFDDQDRLVDIEVIHAKQVLGKGRFELTSIAS